MEKRRTPIYDAVTAYAGENSARFHMPAHFGVDLDGGLYAAAPYDITELDFSDNLANPTGIIAETEKRIASDYGSLRSMIFTSGATTAIFAAVGAAAKRGDTVIMERNCHKSVYSAVRRFGYKPFYVYNAYEDGLPLPLTSAQIEGALDACPEATAVIITSPNYFGRAADTAVADAVRKRGKLLVVDEAHGGHFAFSSLLPKPFSELADFSVESLHKTLPVFTGGAVLNINNEALIDKTKALSVDLHTTSPSYLTMASIDYATAYYAENGEKEYAELYKKLNDFKRGLPSDMLYTTDDFTRLVIKLGAATGGLTAAGIQPETVYGGYGVFIVSPLNAHRLPGLKEYLLRTKTSFTAPKAVYGAKPVKGVEGDDFGLVPLAEAEGRTAYNEVGLYPPGVPLVAHGEVITAEIIKVLTNSGAFGLIGGKICVIL